MKIIINTNSMVPIYEQIMDEIKKRIAREELKSGDVLPSVRALSRDLKISALTVKKAYDNLEQEGFTTTIHGKGTYVTGSNAALLAEEQLREIEGDLDALVKKAKRYGVTADELRQLLALVLEEYI